MTQNISQEPNQLAQAKQALNDLLGDPMSVQRLGKLNHVLNSSQNSPPQGIADGSITETTWSTLSHIASTFDSMQGQVRLFLSRTGA